MITITDIKYYIQSRIWVIIVFSAMNFVCPLLVVWFLFVFLFFCFFLFCFLIYIRVRSNPGFWWRNSSLLSTLAIFGQLSWVIPLAPYLKITYTQLIFSCFTKLSNFWTLKIVGNTELKKILTLRRLWAALVRKRFGVSWFWICARGCQCSQLLLVGICSPHLHSKKRKKIGTLFIFWFRVYRTNYKFNGKCQRKIRFANLPFPKCVDGERRPHLWSRLPQEWWRR